MKKQPPMLHQLASNGNLLAAWRPGELLSGEDGKNYHFAIHSHTLGWRGYCWDEQYGTPWRISPVTTNTVWAYTGEKYLMRLRIEQNGEASITAAIASDHLICANENSCLIEIELPRIRYLRFGEDRQPVSRADIHAFGAPTAALLLADDAVAISDSRQLLVFMPDGEIVHQETARNALCHYFGLHRFLLCHHTDYLYYTDDPRKGWRRTRVPKTHLERTGKHGAIIFFAILGEVCYTAVQHDEDCITLYRASSEESACVEHVWEIKGKTLACELFQHNGLICIDSDAPISYISGAYIPENDGFLVWDPAANAFYADIPHTMSIQKMNASRIPAIRMPATWGRKNYTAQRA